MKRVRVTDGPVKSNGVAHNVAFIKLCLRIKQHMMYRGPSYDVDRTLKVGMAARGFARNETMLAYCSQLRI